MPDEPSVPPHRPGGRFLGTFISFILIAGLFIAGVWIGGHPRQTGLDQLTPGLRDRLLSDDRTAVSSEVLSILEQDYYKPIDPKVLQKAEDASAAALVAAIGDPSSVFMTKDEYAKFLDVRAGTYVGVGIEWHPEGEHGRINRVIPDGPADRAGVKAADVIVAVDGNPVAAKDKYAAMSTVKGKVDYINTHGTSTPVGDSKEMGAIRTVFGEDMPKITSTKSLTGHSLGAAGVQESIYSILMMQGRFIGKSAHIETLDPEFEGMPIVRELIGDAVIDTALSNSFGFGGTNATLVFQRLG